MVCFHRAGGVYCWAFKKVLVGNDQIPMTSSLPEATTSDHKAFQSVNAERVVVLDFGSQYAQLIARRVREQHVYCEIVRHDISAERLAEISPKGIILSGGPASIYEDDAPRCDPGLFSLGIPVLGI